MDLENAVEAFRVFDNFWEVPQSGGGLWWIANVLAGAVLVVQALMMLHMTVSRRLRAAFALMAFGGFAYTAGIVGGQAFVITPAEAIFHWGIVAGFGVQLWRKIEARRAEFA